MAHLLPRQPAVAHQGQGSAPLLVLDLRAGGQHAQPAAIAGLQLTRHTGAEPNAAESVRVTGSQLQKGRGGRTAPFFCKNQFRGLIRQDSLQGAG